ncbi:Glycosyl hydrolase family 57 [Thiorhodovibrio winogradskyi]|uniref:Glycosyl hydrolase family 57 n=1 Tax=Thiorhodovibrio winogradskyi TaxID=77007 RepID=A0ABZ0SDM6_9GAMM|nr:glycosyl hydrolase family 57 [Thiorhodovibrio winogradskyi]
MDNIFTQFLAIDLPSELLCDDAGSNPAFSVTLTANGAIPFPQVILRQHGREHLFRNQQIVWLTDDPEQGYQYRAGIPAGLLSEGEVQVQIEGCRQANFTRAGGDDWIKTFRALQLVRAAATPAPAAPNPAAASQVATAPRISAGKDLPKLHFGIHKHMHQPYYDAADPDYWDGEKDGIFGTRGGPYTDFVPAAIRQYEDSGLPHAGLSCSWSGSLIEQLERCAETGRAGGRFSDWAIKLRQVASLTTASGNRRLDLCAFGFFHPLMPLIPARNIVRHIQQHRALIARVFGAPASDNLFPPETAFHPRIIPALNQAGIRAVIYDSIHRYRACRDYPYGGPTEGMLPPNPAEQSNPPASDWLRLGNVWTGSEIAPSLLKPEYLAYIDPEGAEHKIIGVPAERYIGNEDARGGFGALQYPDVFGQVHAQLERHGQFDPKHPPFFLLHSDGDNHGGGAESYYRHNTAALLDWLKGDPRFELTTITDYLDRFPPDPTQAVHLEPGSWSGADNGDPQFMKWFSRYREPYSPDLNSWAVLTALQNAVHSLEDSEPEHPLLPKLVRLMLTAEASDYWYWTGQSVWDGQVTRAANQAWSLAGTEFQRMADANSDKTGPTLFPPWVTPENPGGQQWRPNGLEPAPREATVHCFAYDLSGIARMTLHLRPASGDQSSEQRIEMTDHGPYPCETGARVTAHYFTAELPPGLGDIRYFLVAEDNNGNPSRGALERIFLG